MDRARCRIGLAVLAGLAWASAGAASAETCPGHPDALGTSRTIVVDPREHPRIGTMQYGETLPLADREVVLTFDDGPIPKHSNAVLDILASECIRATFFIIGRMATEHPEGVRKLIALGHTVGTHSQNHPLSMNRMPLEAAKQEIDEGIAHTAAALGDPGLLSPFFRIPGLLRASLVEDYLASRGIQTWSADFPADDWRHVSAQTVHNLALSRIRAKGKGILLLHDIQPRTVAALPAILRDLKAEGFRIVHVEAATAEKPATPTEPQQWLLHPATETVAITHWQPVPQFAFAHDDMLPAPGIAAADQMMMAISDPAQRPSRRTAAWPQPVVPPVTAAAALPAPAQTLFEIAERRRRPLTGLVRPPHHAGQPSGPAPRDAAAAAMPSLDAGAARRVIPGAIPPGIHPGILSAR